jgi:hypothetical protein
MMPSMRSLGLVAIMGLIGLPLPEHLPRAPGPRVSSEASHAALRHNA